MRALSLLLLLALGACGGAHRGSLEVVPAMYFLDKHLEDVHDADRISLEYPPQGGHVIFVGARVGGLDDEIADLRARLRTPDDDRIIAEEGRVVAFEPTSGTEAIKIPDLRSYSNVANVAVCPPMSGLDHVDRPFVLEVVVTEPSSGRVGSARRLVTPSCLQADPKARGYCQCECAASFVPGSCT